MCELSIPITGLHIDLGKFHTAFEGRSPDHLDAKRKVLTFGTGDSNFIISTVIARDGFTSQPALSLDIGIMPGAPHSKDVANLKYFNASYFGPPDLSQGKFEIKITTPGTTDSYPSIIVGEESNANVFDQYVYRNGSLSKGLSKSFDQYHLPSFLPSMLYEPKVLPQQINVDATVSAFLRQISQNDFSRPRLFAK